MLKKTIKKLQKKYPKWDEEWDEDTDEPSEDMEAFDKELRKLRIAHWAVEDSREFGYEINDMDDDTSVEIYKDIYYFYVKPL